MVNVDSIAESDVNSVDEECLNIPGRTEDDNDISTNKDDVEISVGKVFDSIEDAQFCYRAYGAKHGFSIKKKKTDRLKRGSDEPTGVKFCCNREGTYKPKQVDDDGAKRRRNTSTIQAGCSARMKILNIKDTDKWKVTVFIDIHSHDLVTPSKRVLLKPKRRSPLPMIAKSLTETFSRENLQINKVHRLLGGPSNTEFDDRDLYNHLRKVRAEKLNEFGDAEAVRIYFDGMFRVCKDFYYAIDTDETGRAVNFFWINGRSRLAYKQFGDAITFDTTYKTNKYLMPFAPFTGVNHHRQSLLFGCALLGTEDERTFVWLFQHWLQAVEGRHPVSIITDQDRAMTSAIAKVFPNTRHRFCLWHIKKKFGEKLGHIFYKKSKFKKEMKMCTRFSRTVEAFEEQWANLVVKYELQENNYMHDLYSIRHSWIPIYCRSTFFAGMNTTQRSESINSFFDGFVSVKTSLKDFVVKYDEALESIYLRERKEDYHSIYKKRVLKIEDNLLVHAEKIYTRNIFRKFEEQFELACRLRVDTKELDGNIQTYCVSYRDGSYKGRNVRMNLSMNEGSCECQLFEFEGIPCKHLIRVFDKCYLNEIPSYFILKRWTKYANRSEIISHDNVLLHGSHANLEGARASAIIQQSIQCAYMACKSEEGFQFMTNELHNIYKKLKDHDDSLLQKENDHAQSSSKSCTNRVETLLLDPHISQTKGRNKETNDTNVRMVANNKRLKSGLEKASRRKKARICRQCNGVNVGHDSQNCPNNPKKQTEQSDYGVESGDDMGLSMSRTDLQIRVDNLLYTTQEDIDFAEASLPRTDLQCV